MKKVPIIIPILAVVLLVFPLITQATTFQIDNNYSLNKGETVTGDLYAVGGNSTVSGDITGDLITSAINVFLGGNTISKDVLVLADTANILSNIKQTLRVVGRNVSVSSVIDKDAAFVAWNVQILPESVIGGDLLVAAGSVEVLGKVNGTVHIAAGDIYINESIDGDVSAMANKITLGPNASIGGNFTYSASDQAVIQDGAKIKGTTNFTQINTRTRAERFLPTVWGTISILKFAIALLSALVAHGILKKISERFVVVSVSEFGWSILRGFLVLVAVPFAVIIGTLTLIALPFSIFALALYGIGLLLALVYAPIVIGSLIRKVIYKNEPIKVTWKTILLGVVVSTLLGYIPYLGIIIWYLFVVVALGGIFKVLFDKFIEVR
jgi:hypothetical protein